MYKGGGEKCIKVPPKKSMVNTVVVWVYEDGKKTFRYIQVYTGIYRHGTREGLPVGRPPAPCEREQENKKTREQENKKNKTTHTHQLCLRGFISTVPETQAQNSQGKILRRAGGARAEAQAGARAQE